MTAADTFFEKAMAALNRIRDTQAEGIERAAGEIARSVTAGGMLYTFGTGHAHLLSEEIFYRAGGMGRVCPMLDERLMLHVSASKSTQWERTPGVAREVLARYPVKKGDAVIIFSNSGRNEAPVEMALECKEKGAFVIAVTCLNHSKNVSPRTISGKRLFEAADLVIDNCGCAGDAAVEIGDSRVGPTSTVTGAAILQAIICRVRELTDGRTPFYVSSNVDGGDAINEKLILSLRPSIPHL